MTTLYEVHGSVAVITLSNPPVNGLGHPTRLSLTDHLQQAMRLDIKETATQIEVQANVCNTVGFDAPATFFSVFAIVPRNFVTKPIVILNDLYLPMPCYT